MQIAGPLAQLIKNDQAWEGTVVEAPYLWRHDGRYYLFYSGNGFGSAQYAIGYATADRVAGTVQSSHGVSRFSTGLKTPGSRIVNRK